MKAGHKIAQGFTIIELLVVVAIIMVLATLLTGGVRSAFQSASLAMSTSNMRQLAMGAMTYVNDNRSQYWHFAAEDTNRPPGTVWWFGYETLESTRMPEGQRTFDPDGGPLGGYIPAGLVPDPSFGTTGRAFKPKYKFGYIGIGYNVLLADEAMSNNRWNDSGTPVRHYHLSRIEEVVVFATSAQVNTFQQPASRTNPMIEEFYAIDDQEITVHFRHNGRALVAYANGATGLLEMEPTTRDRHAPEAQIGRFAPIGNTRHLR